MNIDKLKEKANGKKFNAEEKKKATNGERKGNPEA
jgi:hypothetical protein